MLIVKVPSLTGNKLRIAILAWESLHSIHVGGLGVIVTRVAEELAKKGHDVYLFTRWSEGQSKRAKINNVNYVRCKFDPGKDIISFFSNMSRGMVNELRAVAKRSGKFDLVHGHDWHVADALYELKKEGGHVVLSYHSSEYGRLGERSAPGDCSRRSPLGSGWAGKSPIESPPYPRR